MSDWFKIIGLGIIVLVASFILLSGMYECENNKHGLYVKTMWGGYSCVEEGKH